MIRLFILLAVLQCSAARAQVPLFFELHAQAKMDAQIHAAKWKKVLYTYSSYTDNLRSFGSGLDTSWRLIEYDKLGRRKHIASWRRTSSVARALAISPIDDDKTVTDTLHEYYYYNQFGQLSGINNSSLDTLRSISLLDYDQRGRYLRREDRYLESGQSNVMDYEYGDGRYTVRQSMEGLPGFEGKYTISGGALNQQSMPLELARYFEPTMDTQYVYKYEYHPNGLDLSMQKSIFTQPDQKGVKSRNERTTWFDTLGRETREVSASENFDVEYSDTVIAGVRWTRRILHPIPELGMIYDRRGNNSEYRYRLDEFGNEIESVSIWRPKPSDRRDRDGSFSSGGLAGYSHAVTTVLERY